MYGNSQSLIIVPVLVLLGLGAACRLGHDDLVDTENRNSGFGSKSQGPLLGLSVIIDLQLRDGGDDSAELLLFYNLHSLALGLDDGRNKAVENVDSLGIRIVGVGSDHLSHDFV